MTRIWVFTVMAVLVLPMAMAQNVFIVTEQNQLEKPGTGNLADYLRGKGYNVTVDANDTSGSSDYSGDLTAEEISYLESFDVVIVHRAVSSGSYNTATCIAQWNNLNVPLLNGSAYLVRNSRWLWINSAQERSVWEGVDIVQPNHPIVKGLTGVFFDTPLGIDHVGPGDVGQGTIVATILDNNGADAPAIVAWEPGQSFYSSGGQTHKQARVFLPIYRYHENTTGSDPADGDFPNYTQNGLSLIDQAIKWLATFKVKSSSAQNWECY
ncbi:MAG: hypothetical protein GC154_10860 [bacterium]|nr:hypothetical protein [bacterium]